VYTLISELVYWNITVLWILELCAFGGCVTIFTGNLLLPSSMKWNGWSRFLWNVSNHLANRVVLCTRRLQSLYSLSCEHQISMYEGLTYCDDFDSDIDSVWIGNRINWTLNQLVLCSSILQTLVPAVTSSLSLLGSGFQRRGFHFFWIPELSPTSPTRCSQHLSPSSYLTHRLTHVLIQVTNWTHSRSKSNSELPYHWRFTANQFLLASSLLRITTTNIFHLYPCDHNPYVTSFVTRRWVCLLWICLAFRQVYVSHI
jgi:hypothetical protein